MIEKYFDKSLIFDKQGQQDHRRKDFILQTWQKNEAQEIRQTNINK